MAHSDNAMQDGEQTQRTMPPTFGDIRPDATSLIDMPMPDVEVDDAVDEPDASFIEPKPRSAKAKKYEAKAQGVFRLGFNVTVRNERTISDAATILMYGPSLAEAVGDYAAENDWAARAIDMMSDTSDNAAAALLMVAVPFVAQVIRNHEPVAEVTPMRTVRIPFTKREFKLRLNLRLRRLRQITNDPNDVKRHVFGNDAVQNSLRKQGIIINVR